MKESTLFIDILTIDIISEKIIFGPLSEVQGKKSVTHIQEKMFDLSSGKSKLKTRYFLTHFSFRFAIIDKRSNLGIQRRVRPILWNYILLGNNEPMNLKGCKIKLKETLYPLIWINKIY